MIVIGITGTNGAGKGTVVEYLVSHFQFKHFSVGEYLTHRVRQQHLPVNRDNLASVANDLRTRFGPDYLVRQLYAQARHSHHPAIIESLRTPAEVAFLKSQSDFYLLSVDADQLLRYQRIQSRASAKDHVDLPTFTAQEQAEMANTDPAKQNLSQVMAQADFTLDNSGSLAQLRDQIDTFIQPLLDSQPSHGRSN